MAGIQGMRSDLPTELPAKQSRRAIGWRIDRRCVVARDYTADLRELWADLGGLEHLSFQKRILAERVAFLRQRILSYESAVIYNQTRKPDEPERPLPMDAGTYSNHVNV